MKALFVAGVLLVPLTSASGEQGAIFHKARSIYKLGLDLSGIDRLVIRSSRKQEDLEVVPSTLAGARVSGTMEYRIQGFHGSRKHAGVGPVTPKTMEFDQERSGSTLTLRSREWLYIHHSMLYTKLTLYVPEGLQVIVQPYSYEELTEPASR